MLINASSTTSKRSLWPPERSNEWAIDARGSQIRLTDGLWYDDWASALGANTLGYGAYTPAFAPAVSLPWDKERQFADEFCKAMDVEAVRFFKSGSDAVSCAVRLARAFTGRSGVIVFKECYHGTGDWHGYNLWASSGIPPMYTIDTYRCNFGEEMRLFDYAEIAAIVVEPVPKSITLPPPGWLQHLREVCDARGILLISDEVILGYRHTLRGYLRSQNLEADLYAYGKAMGQGAAISACCGRKEIMEQLIDKVHFSGTNNGEWLPLEIARWTLKEYQEQQVCTRLDRNGHTLRTMLDKEGFETRGLNERFEVVFDSPEQRMDATRHCWRRGMLFPGFCSMAVAHTHEQMVRLVEALKEWRDECKTPQLA